ncbi:hypothetical protein GCM10022267_19150 [Lentzea roselyniae]|uniref:Uncharacterized protein n=1 Tax=Lentzea roselyniae TaxID=531940 RepID=A0ABP7AHI4_9PSEU
MADVYHEVMRTIWDHNLHFGLWTSEEDQSSNRIAAERMTALHIDKLGARHGRRVLDLGAPRRHLGFPVGGGVARRHRAGISVR